MPIELRNLLMFDFFAVFARRHPFQLECPNEGRFVLKTTMLGNGYQGEMSVWSSANCFLTSATR